MGRKKLPENESLANVGLSIPAEIVPQVERFRLLWGLNSPGTALREIFMLGWAVLVGLEQNGTTLAFLNLTRAYRSTVKERESDATSDPIIDKQTTTTTTTSIPPLTPKKPRNAMLTLDDIRAQIEEYEREGTPQSLIFANYLRKVIDLLIEESINAPKPDPESDDQTETAPAYLYAERNPGH